MSASFWDEMYGDISKSRPWENPEWVEVCKKQIEECLRPISLRKHSLSLLDFGCGAGSYFPLFQELGFNQITGVDISKVVIDYLREKYGENPSIRLMAGDIRALQSNAIKYDVIMFWGVAHHLDPKEWDVCLQRFDELLSADGVLLVSGWGGDDPRFIKGSPAFSVHSHKQTWSIDAIRSLLESRFIIEEFGNLHYQNKDPLLCSDAFNFYMCKKKLSIEQRLLSNLRSYLSTLYDRISFTQFIRYSFESDVKNAQMDREKSVTYYRDKSELIDIFGSLIRQVIEKCGRNTSFTTEIYQRPQKYNIFVEMDANPKKLQCVGNSNGIRYYFRGDEQGESSHYRYFGTSFTGNDIQETSVKELFSQIEGEYGSNYQGCDFSDLKKVGTYSRVDTFAEKLFYAFNQGRKLFFYYFNNATLKVSHKELGDGGLMIYATSALSNEELVTIDTLFKGWASALSIDSFAKLSAKLATKSAIGAIMSRNGSHNIGSHVLAALSHNVGTMPDDRVLYQYIQHRMDYIATATTEFPTWTQPTMVVGEMMKTFLSQRHLLDFITSSEGLKGWQFQNDSLGVRGKHEQTGCLRFHVRRIDKTTDGHPLEFIDYKSDDSKVSLEHDLALAIPGGIVGQHAFFTIIENIIRNAAKHDWSSPPLSTRMLKYRKSDGGKDEIQGNLDVYIDLEDRPEDGEVEIVIYTRMSDVFDGVELSDTLAQTLKSKPDIIQSTDKRIGDKKQDQQRLPLHDQQRLALGRSFIDSDGSLRRENWGLAEMKISAGYLQRREIAEIGGLDVDDGNNNATQSVIISPIAKKDEGDESNRSDYVLERSYTVKKDEGDDQFSAPVYHLAYKFRVPKPKLVLFVSDSQTLPNGWKKVETQFKKYGIYACTQKDITANDSLNYRYVILDSFDFDEKATCQKLNWRMPFRVISMSPTTVPDAKLLMPTWTSTDAKFVGCSDVNSVLEKLVISIDENARELLNDLAAQWSCYMQCRRFSEINDGRYAPIGSKRLLLQIETGDEQSRTINAKVNHHAGKSIITEADVVAYVFEECFDTMIDTFGDLYQNDGNIGNLLTILDELKVDRFKGGRMIEDALRERSGDYASLVNYQLRHWVLRRIIEGIADVLKDDFDVLRAHLDIRVRANESGDIGRMSYSEAEEAGRAKNLSDKDFLSWMEQWESAVQMFEDNSICARHPIDIFVEYVCAFCKQIKVYLSKYAEEIRTLPKGFSSDNGPTEDVGIWKAGNVDFWKGKDDRSHIADGFKYDIQEDRVVKYKRHFDAAEGSDACIKTNEGAIPRYCCSPYRYGESYIEPLSGTQCYLNSIDRIHISDTDNPGYEMMSRLVENSMLRILIVDERVAKFLLEHSSVISATYSILGIGVVDDKYVEQKLDEIDRAIKNNTNLDSICQKDILPIRKVDGADFCLEKMEMSENAFLPNGLFKVNARNIHELRDLIQKSIEDEEYKCQLDSFVENLQTRFARTWDALIIHQGIIDKWFPALAHSSECMEKALDALRHIFPYVVITTGRGTPANIPSGARVLPFSTIETTLFKKYPEKLVLVDAIMGILPKGETQCKR